MKTIIQSIFVILFSTNVMAQTAEEARNLETISR
jgi:hypothetical protein